MRIKGANGLGSNVHTNMSYSYMPILRYYKVKFPHLYKTKLFSNIGNKWILCNSI
jgi:hypothetical protein